MKNLAMGFGIILVFRLLCLNSLILKLSYYSIHCFKGLRSKIYQDHRDWKPSHITRSVKVADSHFVKRIGEMRLSHAFLNEHGTETDTERVWMPQKIIPLYPTKQIL